MAAHTALPNSTLAAAWLIGLLSSGCSTPTHIHDSSTIAGTRPPAPAPADAPEQPDETEAETEEAASGPWGYQATGEMIEVECPDDLPDDRLDECNPIAKLTVVAKHPDGREQVVHAVEGGGDYFDAVWADLEPLEGSADPHIAVLQLIMESGADYHSVSSETMLVRLDPSTPGMEILFSDTGESQSEMDSCLTYDVVGFLVEDEGATVVAVRESETVFTEQDGLDVECDPEPFARKQLERIRVVP